MAIETNLTHRPNVPHLMLCIHAFSSPRDVEKEKPDLRISTRNRTPVELASRFAFFICVSPALAVCSLFTQRTPGALSIRGNDSLMILVRMLDARVKYIFHSPVIVISHRYKKLLHTVDTDGDGGSC